MQLITDKDIVLIESSHTYELKDDPDFEFTSCTSFVKYFFEPFDKIGIALNLTDTHPNYTHLTPQELVSEWDDIASEGTQIHLEIEKYIKDSEAPEHPKSRQAVKWLEEYLADQDRYKLYSEVIVYSKELALAGTIDLLIHDSVNDAYKLLDWKTNKKIFTSSFGNKTGIHQATNHLMDCNYYHYSIQLSLYRYILEEYYGLKVTGSAISHLTDRKVNIYKTGYHLAEVENMLKADREALKLRAEAALTKDFD